MDNILMGEHKMGVSFLIQSVAYIYIHCCIVVFPNLILLTT